MPTESKVSQYTKGPWEIDRGVVEWHQPRGVRAIAIWKDEGSRGTPVAWVRPYMYVSDEQAWADARLIAASPALAEAALAILNSTDYCDDERPLMQDLRNALQKAGLL